METEKREFFRLNYKAAVQFKPVNTAGGESAHGNTLNISQNGILFQTEEMPPNLSSIVWMNLDLRTVKICQEIEAKALILNNGILGKVVRVEEDADKDNAYDVGVCFLRKDQKDSPEVLQAINRLK